MFIKDKVAIITGGASGLGLYYAKELLKNGLRGVTLADVDAINGEKAAESITEEFGPNKVHFVQMDVTDIKQFEDAFKQTIKIFNNVDILINNAGIANDSIWEKEIAINVNGTFHGCLLGMDDYLTKYKSGSDALIVNISSTAGLQPSTFFPIYATTKHAIVGLGKGLGCPESYETTKVRVVTICPGVTNTPIMEQREKKCLNERYMKLFLELEKKRIIPRQEPEVVAKGMIRVVEEGANGSFWIIEDGETYEIEIPEKDKLKRK